MYFANWIQVLNIILAYHFNLQLYKMFRNFIAFLVCVVPFCIQAQEKSLMKVADVMAIEKKAATAKIQYGEDRLQFGELRIPETPGPHPVVVIIHGGCWLSAFSLDLMDAMATDLTEKGYATWNLEYRRLSDIGGGWPNTFLDVAQGLNYLKTLEKEYNLNLRRVVVTGHSAGGHLALYLAGKRNIPADFPIADPDPNPVSISGVVSLAGIVDLTTYLVRDGNTCGANVDELVEGLPETVPDRYKFGSPINLLPHGTPTILVTGINDNIVPISHVSPYLTVSSAAKEPVKSVDIPGAGHFEVIAPGSVAWPAIVDAIKQMSKAKVKKVKRKKRKGF